jgi:membrane protein implicated in regulation of membrane protease activity
VEFFVGIAVCLVGLILPGILILWLANYCLWLAKRQTVYAENWRQAATTATVRAAVMEILKSKEEEDEDDTCVFHGG